MTVAAFITHKIPQDQPTDEAFGLCKVSALQTEISRRELQGTSALDLESQFAQPLLFL